MNEIHKIYSKEILDIRFQINSTPDIYGLKSNIFLSKFNKL